MSPRDTIFAPATAPGRAAIAVVRVSGPCSDMTLAAICGDLPTPRAASVRTLTAQDGSVIDRCLVLRFVGPASFTGEDSFELQCHGGVAVVSAVLASLTSLGLRLARPGEFTRRALENGRMDLIEAEALADLAAAETEAQRQQAVRGLTGGLSAEVSAWRRDLIRARALVEAVLDFADEEVPVDVGPEATALISGVGAGIETALAGAATAERVREGFEVALVGAPNAGKSTLLNALAQRDAALTSEVAGTTRDVIEVRMDIRGLPVTLLDTAGLRDTQDPVEALGVARARQRADAADLRILLTAPGDVPMDVGLRDGDLRVASKADLGHGQGMPVSAVSGQGVATLMDAIANALAVRAANPGLATRHRHRVALVAGAVRLRDALKWLCLGDRLELAAEELRLACEALDALLGRVDADEVLDDIFREFCLGK